MVASVLQDRKKDAAATDGILKFSSAKAPAFNHLGRMCLMTFVLAVANSLFDLDQDSCCRLVDSR